jgi:NADH-quinone oxidoreductase subunit J
MNLHDTLFYVLSFVAILCALMVVTRKNPIHSVLYLILSFFAIAGHYILLNAQFLAVVHIIVYAGAIMVLFLFVLMLMNLNAESEPHKSTWVKFAGAISGGLLLLVIVAALQNVSVQMVSDDSTDIGLIENLGNTLFNKYVLPFEVSSVLFISAMVGAVVLGKKE